MRFCKVIHQKYPLLLCKFLLPCDYFTVNNFTKTQRRPRIIYIFEVSWVTAIQICNQTWNWTILQKVKKIRQKAKKSKMRIFGSIDEHIIELRESIQKMYNNMLWFIPNYLLLCLENCHLIEFKCSPPDLPPAPLPSRKGLLFLWRGGTFLNSEYRASPSPPSNLAPVPLYPAKRLSFLFVEVWKNWKYKPCTNISPVPI